MTLKSFKSFKSSRIGRDERIRPSGQAATHQIIQLFVVGQKRLVVLLFAFDKAQNLAVEIVIIGCDYAVCEFLACLEQERYGREKKKRFEIRKK